MALIFYRSLQLGLGEALTLSSLEDWFITGFLSRPSVFFLYTTKVKN